MQIVWFKRDLRIYDHSTLTQAAEKGTLLPLYIFEPELWRQPDASYRHFEFLKECLIELDSDLHRLGQSLIIRIGDAVEILDEIANNTSIAGLWSHQETGNHWTYDRDQRVKKWAKKKNIVWHEPVQNGVVRCLANRTGWSTHWYREMTKPLISPPKHLAKVTIASDSIPSADSLGLSDDGCIDRQTGGRTAALRLLDSFLYDRGEGYTKEMSSPVTAYESCSRISPHLAFGTVSIREVFQKTEARTKELKKQPVYTTGKWPNALRSFSARLRWHCHFIQKLEDEPRIEFENMHSIYDGARENSFNQDYFEAWKAGKTGYPMVDACMRALMKTGWLNFRMRAMLMSFSSYHLWLHWREPALHLARLFTDYEPGIHYSQVQMQSGTTGINSIRIYNPIKQGLDHDPSGVFIREWIPELANMPLRDIHTPWKSPSCLNHYVAPIIDEKTMRHDAAKKIYGMRKNPLHREEARMILKKHGSRKSNRSKITGNKKKVNTQQNELEMKL